MAKRRTAKLNEKLCHTCGVTKPFSEFYKNSYSCDGLCSVCKLCRKIKDHEKYKINKTQIRSKNKEYYHANKEQEKKRNRITNSVWRKANTDKIRRWREANKDKINARIIERAKLDPKFRLNRRFRSHISRSLGKSKNGRHWGNLVGYTIDDLKHHLEKQFKTGMTWENYGEWHIDHIVPVSAFNFSSPDHHDFKRCWALSNLQPLWAKDNIRKRAKLTHHFQPSLAI